MRMRVHLQGHPLECQCGHDIFTEPEPKTFVCEKCGTYHTIAIVRPINMSHDWELRWIGGEQNDWVCARCQAQADSQEDPEFNTSCEVSSG